MSAGVRAEMRSAASDVTSIVNAHRPGPYARASQSHKQYTKLAVGDMTVGERLLGLVADADGALFGVPGGQTLPLYAASRSADVRHLVVRDERNAVAAADAHARLTGIVGVCDATVGPGGHQPCVGPGRGSTPPRYRWWPWWPTPGATPST